MGNITWRGNSGWHRLAPAFAVKVRAWVADLSHDVYVVNNGSWRSHWRQLVLWIKWVTGQSSIPANFPGTSAHNRAGKAWAIDVHPVDANEGYDEMHSKAQAHGMRFASNERWHMEWENLKKVPPWAAAVGYLLWVVMLAMLAYVIIVLFFKKERR